MMKLAFRTGAALVPVYVFGGADFFKQLATHKDDKSGVGKLFAQVSRRLRGGVTFFWGQYGLPIPYAARTALVIVFRDHGVESLCKQYTIFDPLVTYISPNVDMNIKHRTPSTEHTPTHRHTHTHAHARAHAHAQAHTHTHTRTHTHTHTHRSWAIRSFRSLGQRDRVGQPTEARYD